MPRGNVSARLIISFSLPLVLFYLYWRFTSFLLCSAYVFTSPQFSLNSSSSHLCKKEKHSSVRCRGKLSSPFFSSLHGASSFSSFPCFSYSSFLSSPQPQFFSVVRFAASGEKGDEKVEQNEQQALRMPSVSADSRGSCGRVARWMKKVGDEIKKGEIVVVLHCDKADVDVEAIHDGYLSKILIEEGKVAGVGEILCMIAPKTAQQTKKGEGNIIPANNNEEQTNSEDEINRMKDKIIDIYMPMLSSTMNEGKVTSWLKTVGDFVKVGNSILVVESDKADMEVEAFEEGYLVEILVKEGKSAKVGEVIAKLVPSKNDYELYTQFKNSQKNVNFVSETKQNIMQKDPDREEASRSTSAQRNDVSEARIASVPGERASAASPSSRIRTEHENYLPDSVDLFVTSQLPEGFSPQQLGEEFIERINGTAEGAEYLRKLQSTSGGREEMKKMIERAQLRPPSKNILLANLPANPNSIWSTAGGAHEGAAARDEEDEHSGVQSVLPSAKKLIERKGVDVTKVKGTGKYGRVTVDDVMRYLDPSYSPSSSSSADTKASGVHTPPAHSPTVLAPIVPMNAMQKAIAKNMDATLNIPVFRVSYPIYTDAFDALYSSVKSKGVSTSVLLAKAVALTLQKNPIINAAYDTANGESIKNPSSINIAMAVSIEGGLVTPVLRDAQSKNIYDLSNAWRDLVEKARSKKLGASDCSGGTFYISNLGMFGVNKFDAILPSGVGGILAVGKSSNEVVPIKGGEGISGENDKFQIGIRKKMIVTITCDHRHIYGADAAQFLKDLANLIENEPMKLLL